MLANKPAMPRSGARTLQQPRSAKAAARNLLRDTRGAGYVEYLILVGCIAIAAQTGFRVFGKAIANVAKKQGVAISMVESGAEPQCVGGLCVRRRERSP